MSTTRVTRQQGGPGGKWWLPVLLALIVVAIIAGAYWATHPHLFGSSATSTPAATATPKPGPTGTPKPGPTGTAAAGPTNPPGGPTSTPGGPTPTPGGPTNTPQPGPTATSGTGGIKLGAITHPIHQIDQIQRGSNQGNPNFTYYKDPFKVVQHNLTAYGFTGPVTFVTAQPPAPTPTPHTNPQGLPEVTIDVSYQGKKYAVVLDQPVQKGPAGIWVIITISAI